MIFCTRWIQKSPKFIFLSCFVQEKKIPGHTKPQNFEQKNSTEKKLLKTHVAFL